MNVSSADQTDSQAFVSQYDSQGTLVWSRQFDSPPEFTCFCIPYGVSSDGSGIYVGGSTNKALPASTNGSGGSFLRKYDWNGNIIWTTAIDGGIGTLRNWENKSGVYALGGVGMLRYDENGKRLWMAPTQGEVFDFSVAADSIYVGGLFRASTSREAFIASYSQSSSLIFFGVNPPFSFIIVGGLVTAATISVVWLSTRGKRVRPLRP
jgi:hypothetical protein